MRFAGDIEDRCPISYTETRAIKNPVGFDEKHAFECDDLVEWLTHHRACNPMTSEPVRGLVVDILRALIVEGDDAHVAETQARLARAGPVWNRARRPPSWSEIRDGVLMIKINMVALAAVMYLLSLPVVRAALTGPGVVLVSTLAMASSFAHLLYQTCSAYPLAARGVILDFCVVGAFVFVGCSPGTPLMTKLLAMHGCMLTRRILLDTVHAFAAHRQ